jgi:hypothetical protein
MGRGRAKAKQTKVARDLKYRSHDTDFAALARELHGEPEDDSGAEADQDEHGPDEHDDWQADSDQ